MDFKEMVVFNTKQQKKKDKLEYEKFLDEQKEFEKLQHIEILKKLNENGKLKNEEQ